MKLSLPASLTIGALVTGVQFFIVARLSDVKSQPVTHSRARPPVLVDEARPPPTSPRLRPAASARVAPPSPRPAPEPLRARSILPSRALAPSGLSLASALPGLSAEGGLALRSTMATQPDRAAVPKRSPAPIYPIEARRRGIEGFVVLRMRVDARGRVTDAVVVESEPDGVFDRSARTAALAARFLPARSCGRPVASTLEQRLRFRLR